MPLILEAFYCRYGSDVSVSVDHPLLGGFQPVGVVRFRGGLELRISLEPKEGPQGDGCPGGQGSEEETARTTG